MTAAVFIFLVAFPGLLALDVTHDVAYDVDPPHVAAQRVMASRPVHFNPASPLDMWRQVLPFDVELRETSVHIDSKGTRHATAIQMLGEVPIWNAVGNLNIKPDGTLLASFQRFLQDPSVPQGAWGQSTLSAALGAVGEAVSNPELSADKGELVYVRDNGGNMRKAWHFYAMEGGPVQRPNLSPQDGTVEGDFMQGGLLNAPTSLYEHYWDALVDAETLNLIALTDLVHKATPHQYNVFSIPSTDPEDGSRAMQTEVFDDDFSPIGYHDLGPIYGNYVAPYSIGNNVFAMTADYRSYAFATRGVFDFDFNSREEPEEQLSFCLTQLFYTNNRLHDIFYAHGFNEESGNFQLNNFGHGGKELDPVYTLCHANGRNNAMMLTLPDGSPGVMSMFIWDITSPKRDSALDSGVVTHEYTHGVSQRLTGGPSTLCLSSTQSGGLGEGWGDFMALAFHFRGTDHRNMKFGLGGYLIGYSNGVRRYPYTSDTTVNPTDWSYYVFYKSSLHQLGEIWAIMLYECYWNLVEEFGWHEDLVTGDGGNNLMISLVIDGMKYQPCEPTFLQARDSIFAALYDREDDPRVEKAAGALWAAFAKRGLGENARDGGVADYDVPADPASLVSGSPGERTNGGSVITGKASSKIVDAIFIVLAVAVVILALCALSLVFRNWRLRRALHARESKVPNSRTPLRAAVDSPYQV